MIWNPTYKAVYIDVPKTASTTLLDTLLNRYGFMELGRHCQKLPAKLDYYFIETR